MDIRTPAAARRIDDATGTLVPGKSADLLVLAQNPLTNPTTLRRPELVIKGGMAVAERGRLVMSPGA